MGYIPRGHKELDTTKQQQWYVLRALQVLLCTLIKKEYVKAEYCHPAYLTYMRSTPSEVLGRMKHKLESRLPGEILITSDTQMT